MPALEIREMLQEALSAPRQNGWKPALGSVLDALPACICYVDREERFLLCNRTYETWFGMPRSQIVGSTVRDVLGPEAYMIAQARMLACFSGRRVDWLGDMPYPLGSKQVQIILEPDSQPTGEVVGFYGLFVEVLAR